MPELELPSILQIAKDSHGDQTYGEGEPYVLHLLHVANVLREYGLGKPHLIAAAYLHDVLEDTPLKRSDLRNAGVSSLVCELVEVVTNEPGKNRRERHAATYPKIAGWQEATVLKLADRIANVRRSIEKQSRHLEMYRKEYPGFRRVLWRADHEVAAPLWKELDSALRNV